MPAIVAICQGSQEVAQRAFQEVVQPDRPTPPLLMRLGVHIQVRVRPHERVHVGSIQHAVGGASIQHCLSATHAAQRA
eukprot:11976864-Alexandrium_andersonii.AAC.1